MKKSLTLPLILFVSLMFGSVWAENSRQEIPLKPVHKYAPPFVRSKKTEIGREYSLKMMKLSNIPQMTAAPITEAVVIYYGRVKLGVPAKEYGVVIDFEGKEKQIWVDSDGDGDYAEESPTQIFKSDRYPGINVYYSPTPLMFTVKYAYGDHTYQTQLQFDLTYLLIARTGMNDVFFLQTRTWFTGIISDNGDDVGVAIVDTNDNGLYNDPDDLLFIDRDYDLNFTPKEGIPLKRSKKLTIVSKLRYQPDFQFCPEKLIFD